MAASRSNGMLRRLFRAPAYLYRWRCGWLLGRRFLLLVHIGRRTGRRRCTVLEIVEYREDGPEAVVISAFGRNADWLRNIEATPDPELVIASRQFTAACRVLGEEEAVRVLGNYQQRHRLAAPIIRAVLSRLLGWRYDGSEAHRRRLAAQLPFIAFCPRSRAPGIGCGNSFNSGCASPKAVWYCPGSGDLERIEDDRGGGDA